jgi:hypothetical protein
MFEAIENLTYGIFAGDVICFVSACLVFNIILGWFYRASIVKNFLKKRNE